MATVALSSSLPSSSSSTSLPSASTTGFLSQASAISFIHALNPLYLRLQRLQSRSQLRRPSYGPSGRAHALNFTGSLFEEEELVEDDDDAPRFPFGPGISLTTPAEDKPDPPCPPGLRQYETMAVLRPDMTEDERLSLTQKYEELLVAGGGMYVEVFNRGVIPLAYSIRKKNKEGETNTYLDGIYLLFTYFTKPESMAVLEDTLRRDDDVIRSSSFKVRKRKY
ncbi:40S ribosomal protein S6 [Dionaea muscipula]